MINNSLRFLFATIGLTIVTTHSCLAATQGFDSADSETNTLVDQQDTADLPDFKMPFPPMMGNSSQPKSKKHTVIRTPNKMDASLLAGLTSLPYGYNLFTALPATDKRTGINPNYIIAPGDRVSVNIWGAITNELVLTVDPRGNVFVPDVGPISVAGLPASELNNVIQGNIRQVYQDNVEVYVNLEDRVPVSIFISGAVRSPGRYTGEANDSLIDYLSKAGGIDLARGSFRNIRIVRGGQTLENYDLYGFLQSGKLPNHSLKEGDVIVVSEKGDVVEVSGAADESFAFEFKRSQISGSDILRYAHPKSNATHVGVTGFRDGKPFNQYITIAEFSTGLYQNQDKIFFEEGKHSEDFKIFITGEHLGPKTMVINKETRLRDVLENIPVDPKLSRIDAIYLKRKSVAEQQKRSIQDSIKRLQETLLLARASGKAETAPMGVGELNLLEKFIAKTEGLVPEGRVVVMGRDYISDMALEEGDEITVPTRSDLITINGEVRLPKAIVWNDDDSLSDYISRAGGFTDNANDEDVIVVRANGETELGKGVKILPGDEIIVMPEVKINNLDLASSVADILYKAVLAVAIPIRLNN